jgi:predicted anti-sigma-YlaC factor YlaD
MILNCRQLVERASDAREGALSRIERATYRAHLALCRGCRGYVAQLAELAAAARAAVTERRAPDDVRAFVRALIGRRDG